MGWFNKTQDGLPTTAERGRVHGSLTLKTRTSVKDKRDIIAETNNYYRNTHPIFYIYDDSTTPPNVIIVNLEELIELLKSEVEETRSSLQKQLEDVDITQLYLQKQLDEVKYYENLLTNKNNKNMGWFNKIISVHN